jgi:hypothetical protein
MTPSQKGTIAAGLFGAVHLAIVVGGFAVLRSPAGEPSPVAARPATLAPSTANVVAPSATPNAAPAVAPAAAPTAAPQVKTEKDAAPVRQLRAPAERKAALAFLTDLSRGEFSSAHARLSFEARKVSPEKKFAKSFRPLSTAGLQQVTWTSVKQQRGVAAYMPEVGYTKTPAVTALTGTMSTSTAGTLEIELHFVESSNGWQVQYFRYKALKPLKTAAR